MTKKITWVVEVRGRLFKGEGQTIADAKADANRKALLSFWGQI